LTIRPLRRCDLTTSIYDDRSRPGGEMYLERQNEGRAYIAVAEVDGLPVGRVGLDFERPTDGDVAYLWEAHVESDWQGRGIGSALIEHLEAIGRERGYAAIDVAVVKTNDRARRLYDRLGYVVYGEGIDRWSFTEDGRTVNVVDRVWKLRKQLV
jgi:ribosomal protein S18 acetylase RimI-like enzyme